MSAGYTPAQIAEAIFAVVNGHGMTREQIVELCRMANFLRAADQFGEPMMVELTSEAEVTLRDLMAMHAPAPFHSEVTAEEASRWAGVPKPDDESDLAAMGRFWNRCESLMRYRFADAMLIAREVQP